MQCIFLNSNDLVLINWSTIFEQDKFVIFNSFSILIWDFGFDICYRSASLFASQSCNSIMHDFLHTCSGRDALECA